MSENTAHLNTTGVEIERKYLIEYPDLPWLEQQPGVRRVEIVQTYLLGAEGETLRVRQWTEQGETVYIETCKSGCLRSTSIPSGRIRPSWRSNWSGRISPSAFPTVSG